MLLFVWVLFLSLFGLIYRDSKLNFHLIYLCASYMARLVYAWLAFAKCLLIYFRFTDLNREWLQSKKSSESDKVGGQVASSCRTDNFSENQKQSKTMNPMLDSLRDAWKSPAQSDFVWLFHLWLWGDGEKIYRLLLLSTPFFISEGFWTGEVERFETIKPLSLIWTGGGTITWLGVNNIILISPAKSCVCEREGWK